jgi:hypothetical protein
MNLQRMTKQPIRTQILLISAYEKADPAQTVAWNSPVMLCKRFARRPSLCSMRFFGEIGGLVLFLTLVNPCVPFSIFGGYLAASAIMMVAAVAQWLWGVRLTENPSKRSRGHLLLLIERRWACLSISALPSVPAVVGRRSKPSTHTGPS